MIRCKETREYKDFQGRQVVDVTTYSCYGVATISRLLNITGLFCKRAL